MRALVTGGGGFLGRALVEALLAEGCEVTSLGRSPRPELEARGARTVRADVADAMAVAEAVRGHDTVFHTAARVGVWGPRREFVRTNVLGTRNVIAACERHGVRRLVFTSSPSVVFDGTDHLRPAGELPYPERFLCAYAETKATAEREVLAANGRSGLATCALRPHLVFGPGDPHLLPRVRERARAGRLFVVGDGANEVSPCYVGNAVRAHIAAARSLAPDSPHAGRAYFVAQREPVLLWEWIADLLRQSGLPPPRRRVSARAAYAAGATFELLWRLLHRPGEPPLTRFVALQLSRSHSYDLAPAERDFGYREEVSMAEAMERTAAAASAVSSRSSGP